MKIVRFLNAGLMAATVLGATGAFALSVDEQTMTGSNGSAYTDPDERTPLNLQSGGNSGATGSSDPSAVRYDYDPASGSYIPRSDTQK